MSITCQEKNALAIRFFRPFTKLRADQGETALEIDHIGEGGLKSTEGIFTRLDRNAKTFTIKAEDGTEHEFRLTEHAAEDAGNDISEDAQKSTKVTVYYTEQAGHQVAHYFSKSF